MPNCQGTGCSEPSRYLLRLRSEKGEVFTEFRLCPKHYEVAIVLIQEVAPEAEHQISGYESEQSKAIH